MGVYVGHGQGEFAVEPAMKYVGYGGDYTPRRTPGNLCCLILPALACLLLTWCCSFGYKSCPTDAAAAGGGYGAGTEHGADFNGAPIAQIRDTPYQQAQSR